MSPTTPTDTIAAVATPPGRGGVGIIRVSGSLVPKLFKKIFNKETLLPRQAIFSNFYIQNQAVDQGLALYFPAPNSFTGESVLEIQTHGSPVILDRILEGLLVEGVRLAEPGEFSKRAYLNDRMDLAQAEAVADLITATTRKSAQMAFRSLQGDFSKYIYALADKILNLRMYVEAAIDFPDEEVDFLQDGVISSRLSKIEQELEHILLSAQQGVILQEGIRLVIAGEPNAGKSSLLNALAENDVAIVTSIPGTTRDVVRETIQIRGVPFHVIDTAGIRETKDEIEQAGIERTHKNINTADVLLWVIDESTLVKEHSLDETMKQLTEILTVIPDKIIIILNKADITSKEVGASDVTLSTIRVSAKTGLGLGFLKQKMIELVGLTEENEGAFIARKRHVTALTETLVHVKEAGVQLEKYQAGELVAEELKVAHQFLGSIVGFVSSDDLLGEIFSSFCIGK